jgi:hypothetical protein
MILSRFQNFELWALNFELLLRQPLISLLLFQGLASLATKLPSLRDFFGGVRKSAAIPARALIFGS